MDKHSNELAEYIYLSTKPAQEPTSPKEIKTIDPMEKFMIIAKKVSAGEKISENEWITFRAHVRKETLNTLDSMYDDNDFKPGMRSEFKDFATKKLDEFLAKREDELKNGDSIIGYEEKMEELMDKLTSSEEYFISTVTDLPGPEIFSWVRVVPELPSGQRIALVKDIVWIDGAPTFDLEIYFGAPELMGSIATGPSDLFHLQEIEAIDLSDSNTEMIQRIVMENISTARCPRLI